MRKRMHERTLQTRRVFDGRLLHIDIVDIELADGTRAVREIVRHPGAAVVLPRTADGRFVLVRQFRKPADAEILEAVAGTLDAGEDPASCARRELAEETGYHAASLEALGNAYPAPGYTDERLSFFFAEAHEEATTVSPDDDERIEVVHLTAEAIDRMVGAGEIQDAKTLAIWLLFKSRGGLARSGVSGT